MALIAIVERETYNRWDTKLKNFLTQKKMLKEWYVHCLWEADYGLVGQMMELLFNHHSINNPEAQELQQAFRKHIAFVGRGIVGRTLWELQKHQNYWQLDPQTQQPFIILNDLDSRWVENNAWIQETLERNWTIILGQNFPQRENEDRAKQGVYALMDWIIEHAKFNREDILEATEHLPILISPYGRLRNEVVSRLLEVLVENGYLHVLENEYDIIWGMDVADHSIDFVRTDFGTSDIIRKSLEGYLEEQLEEYEAVHRQLGRAWGEVERTRLKRRAEELENEIDEVREKLNGI